MYVALLKEPKTYDLYCQHAIVHMLNKAFKSFDIYPPSPKVFLEFHNIQLERSVGLLSVINVSVVGETRCPLFGLVRPNPGWIIQNPIAGFAVWGEQVERHWEMLQGGLGRVGEQQGADQAVAGLSAADHPDCHLDACSRPACGRWASNTTEFQRRLPVCIMK